MGDLSNDLAANQGRKAFLERNIPESNPYKEYDFRHKEWQFGWDCEDQSSDVFFDRHSGKFKPKNKKEVSSVGEQ